MTHRFPESELCGLLLCRVADDDVSDFGVGEGQQGVPWRPLRQRRACSWELIRPNIHTQTCRLVSGCAYPAPCTMHMLDSCILLSQHNRQSLQPGSDVGGLTQHITLCWVGNQELIRLRPIRHCHLSLDDCIIIRLVKAMMTQQASKHPESKTLDVC